MEKDKESSPLSGLASAVSGIAALAPVNDALQALANTRAYAVFRLPDVDAQGPTLDLRSRSSPLVGPKVAFSNEHPNHVLVLHFNGVLYECKFDDGTAFQQCLFVGGSTFFASRPDFRMAANDDAPDAGEWSLV